MMEQKFEMVAKTFKGLEGVLSDELTALGATDVTQGTRMVSFTGDKELLYRANFQCRTALRILKPVFKFRSTDADDLYEQVKALDWESLLTPDSTFAIDSTVYSERFRHSRFVTYRVKDGIADRFMEREGRRPSIRLNAPDRQFDVHINDDQVTISLDSSGEPLYKRGWRVAQTAAPINAVLAAGIIRLSGWDGDTDLIDPMCGSGTFLIEAALIAANINPGVYRTHFAFMDWPDYDADLYDEIFNDDSQEREVTCKISGYDVMAMSIAISEKNVKNAGLSKYITLERRGIEEWEEAPEGGTIITNPPYGERLVTGDIPGLYKKLGEKLKHVFHGYTAWIICPADKDLYGNIGLKASIQYPLLNGELECELLQYIMFKGRYNDMRQRGDDIKNRGFRASERPARRGGDRDHSGDRERRPRRFDGDRDGRRKFDDERPRRFGDRQPRERRDDDETPRPPRQRPREFHGPQLGADAERPIIHGRRKSWKRRDLDDNNNQEQQEQ